MRLSLLSFLVLFFSFTSFAMEGDINHLFDHMDMDYNELEASINQFYSTKTEVADFLNSLQGADVTKIAALRVELKQQAQRRRRAGQRFVVSDGLIIDAALQQLIEHRKK